MHESEIVISSDTVRRLLPDQFPEFRTYAIEPLGAVGTVNAIFRLGEDDCLRMPRAREWSRDIEKEWRILEILAPYLSLKIPEPLGRGHSNHEYPFSWAIYRWIEGQPYSDALIGDEQSAADMLAGFIRELRQIRVTEDAPSAGRRPLRELNQKTLTAIRDCLPCVDTHGATIAWEKAVSAAAWDGVAVWIHGDLLPTNILVRNGHIHAIVDFGSSGKGDPAMDLVPAWSVLNRKTRDHFRTLLQPDADSWNRARSDALHQSALIIPYYASSFPAFTRLAIRTVNEILGEDDD